jgi:hypothetical protein
MPEIDDTALKNAAHVAIATLTVNGASKRYGLGRELLIRLAAGAPVRSGSKLLAAAKLLGPKSTPQPAAIAQTLKFT